MSGTPTADQLNDHDPDPPERQAVQGLDLPEGYVIPAPYALTPGGVFAERATTKEGDANRVRITWAPLLPVRVLTDPNGDQVVELAWRDGYRWVRRLVPKSTMKSGRKLVAALGDADLPVCTPVRPA
jgi:hypothetical protein